MHIFNNTFTESFLSPYKKLIEDYYFSSINQHFNNFSWENCFLDLPKNDPINKKVIDIIESRLRIKLDLCQSELQCWPQNCPLITHRHDNDDRKNTKYNSLLYLNEDFKGGEFTTEYGVSVQPRVGTLTFFDGAETFHGINSFYFNNRYTIIFWWDKKSYWY